MPILDDTIYAIRRAQSQPGFNPLRWQYVLNRTEWEELAREMFWLQPQTAGKKPEQNVRHLEVLGVKVVWS